MSDRYRSALLKLLPSGAAWTRAAGSQLYNLMDALAVEFQRVHDRVADFLNEANPLTATESLSDWERVLKITSIAATPQGRLAAIRAKMLGYVDPTQPFSDATIQSIAAGFGYTVVITHYTAFYVGLNGAGDPVGGADWNSTILISGAPADPAFEAAILAVRPGHIQVNFSP